MHKIIFQKPNSYIVIGDRINSYIQKYYIHITEKCTKLLLYSKCILCLMFSLMFQDLIEMVIQLQSNLCEEIKQKSELEEYLDKLLLRVMETSPKILQTPYICYSRKNHY